MSEKNICPVCKIDRNEPREKFKLRTPYTVECNECGRKLDWTVELDEEGPELIKAS